MSTWGRSLDVQIDARATTLASRTASTAARGYATLVRNTQRHDHRARACRGIDHDFRYA